MLLQEGRAAAAAGVGEVEAGCAADQRQGAGAAGRQGGCLQGHLLPSKLILMVTWRLLLLKVLVCVAVAGVLATLFARPAAAAGNEEAVRRCQELLPAFIKAPPSLTIE